MFNYLYFFFLYKISSDCNIIFLANDGDFIILSIKHLFDDDLLLTLLLVLLNIVLESLQIY